MGLDLQPKLVPIRLGLDQYYPRANELDGHIAALQARINSKPAVPADQYVLLGFMEFQRGRDDDERRAVGKGLSRRQRVPRDVDRLAVQQHGAGAAFSGLAAVLDAEEPLRAQYLQQAVAGEDVEIEGITVDIEVNDHAVPSGTRIH